MEYMGFLNLCDKTKVIKLRKVKRKRRSVSYYYRLRNNSTLLYHSGFIKFFSFFLKSFYINLIFLLKWYYSFFFSKNKISLDSVNIFFFSTYLNLSRKKLYSSATLSNSLILKHLAPQLNNSYLFNSFFKKSLISTDNLDLLQDTIFQTFEENFYKNKLELIPYNASIHPNLIIFNKNIKELPTVYTFTTHTYFNGQVYPYSYLFIFYRFFICLHIYNVAAN